MQRTKRYDDGDSSEHDDDGFEMDFEGIPPPPQAGPGSADAMDVDEHPAPVPECPDDGDDEAAAIIARKLAKGKERAVEPTVSAGAPVAEP